MREVAYRDGFSGDVLLAFDGRVLELFRAEHESLRVHVAFARVEVEGRPMRGLMRPHRSFDVACGHLGVGGGFRLTVPEEDVPRVEELLGAVAAASAAAEAESEAGEDAAGAAQPG